MNKTAIKNFAVWARRKLIADITYKAGLIGVSESGIAQPLPQSTNDLQFFDIGTKDYAQVAGAEIVQRNALVRAIQEKERTSDYETAFKAVIEEVAYTWFNRLIAIRFMEVNEYLPSRIRMLSSENPAKNEPDFVTTPFDTDMEFTMAEQNKIMQLKDENKLDELFRMLFIKQCNKLHEILPELFEKTNDYTELLLSISFTDNDGIVYHLVHDIPEDDFNIEKEGQVEIIGWMYQYYNSELLEDINEKSAVSRQEIPAKTQFFTTDWIVRYLVENSLGRVWNEGHPTTNLKNEWKYYIEEAAQAEEVLNEFGSIRKQYSNIIPEEIKVMDPCMGSGHILVYAFDVLMQIYESMGYTQKEAAKSILVNNIFGLDIDERAYQLAYFAVLMKARQYNRRILHERIQPNLFAIQESNEITSGLINFIAKENSEIKADLNTICNELTDAKEYGSLIEVTFVNYKRLYERIDEIENEYYDDLFDQLCQKQVKNIVLPLIRQSEIMAQKYDAVFTNPPYLGVKKYNKKLSNYIGTNYKAYKYDLFSCFVVKIRRMLKNSGIAAMITQQTWLNVDSFENLRKHIIENDTLLSVVHLGNDALEGGLGTVAFIFVPKVSNDYVTKFIDLTEFGYFEKQNNLNNVSMTSEKNTDIFTLLPKTLFAYNISSKIIEFFGKEKLVKNHSLPRSGLVTRNNNLFLKLWYEVEYTNIDFNCDLTNYYLKWYPHTKGGGYRKWYGNFEYVVNWKNDGHDIREFTKDANGGSVVSQECYFHEGLSWSLSTFSAKFSMRYQPKGFIFNVESPAMFDVLKAEYLLGFLNSCVAEVFLDLLSDSLHYKTNDVGNTPLIIAKNHEEVKKIVLDNILISRKDWDSFESSWDFQNHPLIPSNNECKEQMDSQQYQLEWQYQRWEKECEFRFNQLKANEEELNRIFIDIYGLQDELTPDVEDRDVTVRKADLGRDIRSLLSYAVGCMFGRYSLDETGLAFAGGEWNGSKYSTFIPDKDNCIPITDEAYFEDDIVGLFVNWMKKTFGEENLEENLDFIAKALGNKGTTSREVIRNYFLNDFIKDHIKIYQKRPIYWLFDSGKQNGFKALVYMHRWNADTVGNVRVEYLHKMQHIYEREIQHMQETIDNSTNSKEIAKANKRKEKLQKQLKETQDYDTKLAHIALSRIDIDLDDGVKVNYEKVQTGRDGKKMQILAKI